MGELSEQTLRLREWHVAPGGKLVINLTQPPREEDLPRLHDAVNAFVGSLAARSEAQPSGYDGGKSLGERFQAAFYAGHSDMKAVAWDKLAPSAQAGWERAALTFTASLSDASPKPSSDEQET